MDHFDKIEYTRSIMIGDTTASQIIIGGIDIIKLKDQIDSLKLLLEKQQQMLEALWYRPGAPGYDALEAEMEHKNLEEWKVNF